MLQFLRKTPFLHYFNEEYPQTRALQIHLISSVYRTKFCAVISQKELPLLRSQHGIAEAPHSRGRDVADEMHPVQLVAELLVGVDEPDFAALRGVGA